jgi:hypothetical protein
MELFLKVPPKSHQPMALSFQIIGNTQASGRIGQAPFRLLFFYFSASEHRRQVI